MPKRETLERFYSHLIVQDIICSITKEKGLESNQIFMDKSQALVLRGERIIGSDFCACQEEMQKKDLTAGEAREELLILTHLFCMLLYSVLSEYDFWLFPPLSNGCFILFSHSSQHKKIIILHVHTQCFSCPAVLHHSQY